MATKKTYYKPTGKKPGRPKKPAVSPAPTAEMMEEIRRQVLAELKNEKNEAQARLEEEHKVQQTAHRGYLEKMYASSEPWVEIQSWADTPQGVKVELEWNDAFIAYLKAQGIEGTNDDQTVQKWVALLLMQINDTMEVPEDRDSKFE